MEWKNGYKKSFDTFMKEINENNIHIEIIGVFVNYTTNIKCKCLTCGNIFNNIPTRIIRNQFHGCPFCAESSRRKTRTLKYEEFLNKLPNGYEAKYDIIGIYKNLRTKIECHCKVCNHVWSPIPASLVNGAGCPKCSGNIKKKHDEFKDELYKLFPSIKLTSKYTGARNPINAECIKCGNKWTVQNAGGLLVSKEGCQICAAIKRGLASRRSHTEFLKEFYESCDRIEIVGDYIKSNEKILCKCRECNKEFYQTPSYLLTSGECPYCGMTKGERRIFNYLNKNNIDYIFQKSYEDLRGLNNGLLSYDFYLPSYNLLIEYQGQFHDGSTGGFTLMNLGYQKEHDKRKKQYALDNNIKLLEIWYYDIDKIEEILNKELKIN